MAWTRGGDQRIVQELEFLFFLPVLGNIPGKLIFGLSQLLMSFWHLTLLNFHQGLWINLPKANSPNLTDLPILWIYSWSIFFLNIFLWICSLLNIPNLLILILNTFTEYSQDEYGFKCKHSYEYIQEYIILMTLSKMSALQWEFSHLYWFPLNSCQFLFCQHFSIFRRILLQISQVAYQP